MSRDVLNRMYSAVEKGIRNGEPIWDLPNFGIHAVSYSTGRPYKGINNFFLEPGEYVTSMSCQDVINEMNLSVDIESIQDKFVPVLQNVTRGKGRSNVVDVINTKYLGMNFSKYNTKPYQPANLVRLATKVFHAVKDDSMVTADMTPARMYSIAEKCAIYVLYMLLYDMDEDSDTDYQNIDTDEFLDKDFEIVCGIAGKILCSYSGIEIELPHSEEWCNHLQSSDSKGVKYIIHITTQVMGVLFKFLGNIGTDLNYIKDKIQPKPLDMFEIGEPVIEDTEPKKINDLQVFKDDTPKAINTVNIDSELYTHLTRLCREVEEILEGRLVEADSPMLQDKVLKVVNTPTMDKAVEIIKRDNISTTTLLKFNNNYIEHMKTLEPFIIEKIQYTLIEKDVMDSLRHMAVELRKVSLGISEETNMNKIMNKPEFYLISCWLLDNQINLDMIPGWIPYLRPYLSMIVEKLKEHREILTSKLDKTVILTKSKLEVINRIIQNLKRNESVSSVEVLENTDEFYKLKIYFRINNKGQGKDENLKGTLRYIIQETENAEIPVEYSQENDYNAYECILEILIRAIVV